jgi:hypothetical protein
MSRSKRSNLGKEVKKVATVYKVVKVGKAGNIKGSGSEQVDILDFKSNISDSNQTSNAIPTTEPTTIPAVAPDDHPIFGLSGIMRNLVPTAQNGQYMIHPNYIPKKPAAQVFGHNGLTVGQCWPVRIAALRDGAHGMTVAGISGNSTLGAYSIVVTKHYKSVNEDKGDVLYYSAPYGYSTTDEKADPEKAGAKYLLKSIQTKKPVRVLRHASGQWTGSPAQGLRYDGLYKVESYDERTNDKGGVYASFKMVRMEGQDPIATNKPTPAQIAEYRKIKIGW